MRSEITDLEYIELFSNPMKRLRNAIEEINKMMECRVDSIAKPLREGELNSNNYKTLRLDILRTSDQVQDMVRLLYKRLDENLEKSIQRIEEGENRDEKD